MEVVQVRHPTLLFIIVQGFDIARAKALSSNHCESFYNNLTKLYTKYNYATYHI